MRLCKLAARKPHVGATRGGRSCSPGREEEDPAELKAENLDPEVPVPLLEVGETPASGRLARPPSLPFPFRAPGGRGSRAEPGARRGRSGPRPRGGCASRPLHPSSGRSDCGPAPLAPTRGPRSPKEPSGLGRSSSPSFHFPYWAVGLCVLSPFLCPADGSSQRTPTPTHISISPFSSLLHLRCGDSALIPPILSTWPRHLCLSSRVAPISVSASLPHPPWSPSLSSLSLFLFHTSSPCLCRLSLCLQSLPDTLRRSLPLLSLFPICLPTPGSTLPLGVAE